jgi:hemolysin activation/secretion protein
MSGVSRHNNCCVAGSFALALTACIWANGAQAQAGLGARGFDTMRPDIVPPAPARGQAPADPLVAPAAPAVQLPEIAIADIAITGDAVLSRDALRETVAPFAGRPLTLPNLQSLLAALSAAHRAAGYAIVGLSLPQQDFARGLVVVRVVRGQISDIVIEGDTEGADLTLLRAHAEAIRNEQPLTRRTLERRLLLMNDIPGRKVQARLEPASTVGDARLVISIRRESVRYGVGLDNLGARELGDVQLTMGATVNALLREGDSTRLTVGMPIGNQRFTYVSARHQQPIGTNGLVASVNYSLLELRQAANSDLHGQATTLGIQLAYPVILRPTMALQVFGGFDMLENRTDLGRLRAIDEGTRVLRAGGVFAMGNESGTRNGSLAVVVSQGIDGAGARQRIYGYGDPAFTQVNLLARLDQVLVRDGLTLRLRGTAQYTGERLPASELTTYGGVTVGRAFRAATLYGDRGLTATATVAMPFRAVLPVENAAASLGRIAGRMLSGGEFYAFADYGRTENLPPIAFNRGDRAASAGIGIGLPVAEDTTFNLEVNYPILRPHYTPTAERPRFVFVFRRNF